MAGINLIMNSSKPRVLSLIKSNNTYVSDIPYHMDSYRPLLSHLSERIPEDWQASIETILQEERQLIARRQALMSQYKAILRDTLPKHIDEFRKLHPEFFI